MEFAEAFAQEGFDIMLANPPYVRADAQFKHIPEEDKRLAAIQEWKGYRRALTDSGQYETLYEKWDLYIPFLERAFRLLRPMGQMVFIISDAYNGAKYAQKSHLLFLNTGQVQRVDSCSDIPLFEASIYNTIVHFMKLPAGTAHRPERVRRWGEKPSEFEANAERLPTDTQGKLGPKVFSPVSPRSQKPSASATEELGRICYISYGLRANADDRYWKGQFVTKDLVVNVRDKKHPYPFVEGKDLVRWWVCRVRYLEWGTKRAPTRFARPTFLELHQAKEKLIALVVATGGPPVIYDNRQLFTTHTSCIFVPWHHLKGVRNRSIRKTASYRDEGSNPRVASDSREDLERISAAFNIKYLLAVMNSSFASEWLASRRRSKNHVYPDDWKSLPIAMTTPEATRIASLVDEIMELFVSEGCPLSPAGTASLRRLEEQIDQRIVALYG